MKCCFMERNLFYKHSFIYKHSTNLQAAGTALNSEQLSVNYVKMLLVIPRQRAKKLLKNKFYVSDVRIGQIKQSFKT